MQFRRYRLRLRRQFRKGHRQVGSLGAQAEHHIEENFLGRLGHLYAVRRFVLGWVALTALLIIGLVIQIVSLSGYYQTLRSVPGGIYNEGILGRFTNANPIYAISEVDSSVSHLIFSGLLKYDSAGRLVGDLASSFQANDHGNVYTVKLRPHLVWQDGQPLTSADVVFTYGLIQNPDAQSPLQSSWQGIKVSAPDAQTVIFSLPGTLASFPYNLTTGILPRHLLAKVPASDLRSANFNTMNPVGAGPFEWQGIQVTQGSDASNVRDQIALAPFSHYAGGEPKLNQFIIRTFNTQATLEAALVKGQLTGAEGLDSLPASLSKDASIVQHNLPLRAETMVFFKTSSGILADSALRHALVQAADVPGILSRLGYPVRAVNEPFLTGQIGYNSSYAQPKFDLAAARQALSAAGWNSFKNGVREKNGQPLAFTLSAADTRDDHIVGSQLQEQWRQAGVKLTVDYLDSVDFQNAVNEHDYEALLDGISIGEDPDVFVYWDSSQADIRSANRLNLSEYSNSAADASLEAGRSRLNPIERAVKYRPFLQAWQQDSPALALYQPRDLYLTNGPVAGLSDGPVNSPTDRYANVNNWEIRQAKVTD